MGWPDLGPYRAKRHFGKTPEPPPATEPGADEGRRWVVQQHAARRLHYDLRLEAGGVLVSWAVPKGPSFDPSVKRLAVKVEDHPLEYRDFEGRIPAGNYGAGAVIVWDEGYYRRLTSRRGHALGVGEAVEEGHLSFWLEGHKLTGGWSLTRFDGDNWALVKRRDEHADPARDVTAEQPGSVKTGRSVGEVAASGDAEAVWGAEAGAEGRPGPGPALAPARFCPPMLAQSGADAGPEATKGLRGRPGDWLLEPKLDGLRCIAVRNGDEVKLCSRNRLAFNPRFPAVVNALRALPADNFVLDGEVVALVGGRPDFAALQQGRAEVVEYRVFDLPWLLGRDLRHLPIEERKDLLSRAVPEGGCLKVVQGIDGEAPAVLARMCEQGWEGLVAKRRGSPYREGRSGDWQKLKCGCRQDVVVGGFTEPQGSRYGFGALLVGYWDKGDLAYAGKVGTGFNRALLEELLAQLVAIEQPSCPFAGPVKEKGAHWVEPRLVAEVAFSNWTPDGRLRQPSFLGLRPDKASTEVVREGPGPSPGARGRRPSPSRSSSLPPGVSAGAFTGPV
ncbi:MAG: non-homologous end-joining DNA ligase [Acidimicrobiales bacterium]